MFSGGTPGRGTTFRGALIAVLVVITLLPFSVINSIHLPQPASARDSQASTTTVVGDGTAERPSPAEIAAAMDRLVEQESGVYGVVLMDANGGVGYSRNADTPFVAASLYKLVLIADIYERIEYGELGLDQELELLPEYFWIEGEFADGYYDESMAWGTTTIGEALFAAGAYSSNVAAQALLTLTDPAALDAVASELGMTNTHVFASPASMPGWPPEPGADTSAAEMETAVAFVEATAWDGWVSLTTPRDTAIFFSRLLAGTVVNAETSAAILDLLSQQAVDDRFPVLLPAETEMAHKTGNLDHVIHDAGIIWTAAGPVILAVLVEGCDDDARATEMIQQLALIAYGGGDATPVPLS